MTGSRRVQIREAAAADAVILAGFAARAFVAAFAADNDEQDVRQYVAGAFSARRIRAEIAEDRSTFLLADDPLTDADGPIGYAHLRAGPSEVPVPGGRPVELVRIYIAPELLGAGYGSALLSVCLARAAEDFDVIWLGVWEHNDGARRLYERRGFATVGEHPFHLGSDTQTDLVMARRLTPDDL